MYRIIFIDEEKDAVDEFKNYVDDTNSTEKFEVLNEFPEEDLDEMVQTIFNHNPDAIITDFNLNEYKTTVKYNVPYNGVQLVQRVLSIRDSFPCFVMTSFDDNAIKEIDDVNLVYIKDILHGSEKKTNAKASFLQRVEFQIGHYKGKINEADTELNRLLALRRDGKATLADEEEIVRLDHFLESSIDKRNAIPKEYKSFSNSERLGEILSKVNELLKKVENKDGE